ncbi:hypothetical protein HY024_00625 [Candidatus Curtissbacteria bacterium]|nr:hypothetical protein [Candidatus Curtissbacteria bacterium]
MLSLKKLSTIFLAILALLIISPKPAFAGIEYETDPKVVDENTPTAKITLKGLIAVDYHICLGWINAFNDCDKNNDIKIRPSDIQNGVYSFTVCGGRGHTGPTDPITLKNDARNHCGANDYFHAHSYDFDVEPSNGQTFNGHLPVAIAKPKVTLSTMTPRINESFQLTLAGTRRPSDSRERNEYNIEINGTRIKGLTNGDQLVATSGNNPSTSTIPGLPTGDHNLVVKVDKDDVNCSEDQGWCSVDRVVAGFHIHFNENGSGTITEGTGADIATSPGRNPCSAHPESREPATQCQTALGSIPIDAKGFTQKVLSISLGLAGGIALIFMVYGSIKILISSGDPKKVGEGREVIVAAVTGLLFLIFSVLILKYIGLTILPTNPF